MAHLVKGLNGGDVQALLPGTFRIRRLKAEWEYAEIYDMAVECLEAFKPLPDIYVMNNLERMDLYRRLTTRYVMPELINVVEGEGLWRVPYCAEGRGARTCITEAIACLLTDVSAGRYKVYGVGRSGFEGDVYLRGPLRDFEYDTLVHGQFSPTMRRLGRPGPGLCEAPEQALVLQSPTVHLPRAPRESGQGYDGYGIDDDAPPPFGNQPPNHLGPSPQLGGSRQPRGSRPGAGQFVHSPRGPPQYVTPVSGPSSESDYSSVENSDSPPPNPQVKAKNKKGKAQKKPARRQRSPSEDSIAGGVEDLAVTDEEPVGRRPPKRAPNKATRRVGRSDDEDEPPSSRAPPRPAAMSPPRRDPLATIESRDFAPANGEPQHKRPPAPAASRSGRCVGRSDDETEYVLPPRGQRSAAPRRADAWRRERGRQAVLEDEKPPHLDPAEKARLDALKTANGF
ncbi:MAG: hypothetical protein Q9207_007589 [Kuettlingeria erythrocarpa]